MFLTPRANFPKGRDLRLSDMMMHVLFQKAMAFLTQTTNKQPREHTSISICKPKIPPRSPSYRKVFFYTSVHHNNRHRQAKQEFCTFANSRAGGCGGLVCVCDARSIENSVGGICCQKMCIAGGGGPYGKGIRTQALTGRRKSWVLIEANLKMYRYGSVSKLLVRHLHKGVQKI